MFQTSLFADASTSLAEADFILVGAPFDATASFRAGTREGPDAIRQASYNFETYEDRYDVDLHDLKIFDLGNLVLGSDPAYAWETIGESFAFIPAEATPIFLGGEHSIAPPVVAEVARRHELGVVVLDAHLDLRNEYGGTKMSHACTSRRVLDICDRYASIGIRSGSREEFLYAKKIGLHYHSSKEVAERGIGPVLEDALAEVGCDRIYLSIDFDCLDPAFAPAVGNPEPFGLAPRDVRRAIEVLAPIAAGLDVCEIAPQYDHGQTAILGARLVREFIAAKAAGTDRLPKSDNRS